MQRAILAALCGCMFASATMAQEIPSRTALWAAVGIGAGLPTSGGDGIGNMAQLVYQRDRHHAAMRGLVLHDLDRPANTIAEVGLLYGRTRVFDWGNAAVAAGIAAVAFDTCPDDDDSCFTPGVPIIAEAALSRRFIGLGVQAFGNLNRKASYAGAVLFLQVGRVR